MELNNLNNSPDALLGVDFHCTAKKPIFDYSSGEQTVTGYEEKTWFSFDEIREQFISKYAFDAFVYNDIATMRYMIQARANLLKDEYNEKYLSFMYEVDPNNNYEMMKATSSDLEHGLKTSTNVDSNTERVEYPDGTLTNARRTDATNATAAETKNYTQNSGHDKTAYKEYTHGDMSVRSLPSVLKEMRDFVDNLRREYIDEYKDLFLLIM